MAPVPITPIEQIDKSTKKTLKSFFHVLGIGDEFFMNSDLKITIAAALNQAKVKRNVIAPIINKTCSGIILYVLPCHFWQYVLFLTR